jgi:glycosyltransferase involved in cell wall biosynthesis
VTPSLNQAKYLEQTIRSVLLQGYPNLEYLVMDGGSTDGSVDIIRKYQPHLAYWESSPDGGQASAIKTGFQKAHGEILGFVNSDDLLLPGALATVGRFFAQNQGVNLLIGRSVIIDAEGHILHPVMGLAPTYHSLLFWGSGGFNQPASFWRREAFFSAGSFDSSLDFSFDYDMYLRLTRHQTARSINFYLAAFRRHSASKTYTLQDARSREDDLLRHRYGIDRYPYIVRRLIHGYYHLRYLFLAGSFKVRICIGAESPPESFGNSSY